MATSQVQERNKQGNRIYRDMEADLRIGFSGTSRYPYDERLCEAGWQQYDTDQDASYFGIWVNLQERKVMNYIEGDRILVECDTEDALRAELADMEKFYGEVPPAFISYSADGQRTEFYVARPHLD